MTHARPLYACNECQDTCIAPDGQDACPKCAERAEIEFQTRWQHVGTAADRVVAKALEARKG